MNKIKEIQKIMKDSMPRSQTPAFPFVEPPTSCNVNLGMTLRQYYAAKALQGLAANSDAQFIEASSREMAQAAFRLADAMIAAESDEPEIEVVKAERTDWLECASDIESLVKELQRTGDENPFSMAQQEIIVKILNRYRQTDANY